MLSAEKCAFTCYCSPSFKFLFRHGEHNLDKEFIYLKGLLHSVAHVKNLELSPWCIQCMSTLALEGWQSPPSSWKFLKRNTHVEQLDFPGIYSFLQSSSDLETLVIEWNNSTPTESLPLSKNKDKQRRSFEIHN